MLPEILSVKVEGGGDVLVPVTPASTFRDISACVREPGDALPLLLEDSPLGARVVSSWERPLELLRLWGVLRDQVTYSASFTLSKYLRNESPRKVNYKGARRNNFNSVGLDRIDPWELYDLQDELKNIDAAILNESLTSDLPDSGLDELNDSKEGVKQDLLNRPLASEDNQELLWTSYNSHSKEDRRRRSHRSSKRSSTSHSNNPSQVLSNATLNRSNTLNVKYLNQQHLSKQDLPETPSKKKRDRSKNRSKQASRSPEPQSQTNLTSLEKEIPETHAGMSQREKKSARPPDTFLRIDGQVIKPDRTLLKKEKNSSKKESLFKPFRGFIESAFYQNSNTVSVLKPDQNPSRHSAFRPFKRTAKHPCLSPDSHYNSSLSQGPAKDRVAPTTSRSQDIGQNDLKSPKTAQKALPNYEDAIKSLRHSQRRLDVAHTAKDKSSLPKYPSQSSHILGDYPFPETAQTPLKNSSDQSDRNVTPLQNPLKSSPLKYLRASLNSKTDLAPHPLYVKNSPTLVKEPSWTISAPYKTSKHTRLERRQNSDSLVQYSKSSPSPRQGRSRPQKRRQGAGGHKRSYSDPLYESRQEANARHKGRRFSSERRRRHSGGGISTYDEGMRDLQQHLQLIPDGGEVTVSELREMATRQQQQIENQQQLLVAREQRLKYLKQQEGRAAQVTMEAEKLRRLRERVEAQEAKLRRLRALRGQVDSSCLNAASLSSDLEAMRQLFSEKEKELVVAASKVEELTRQLEDLRQGRHAPSSGGSTAPTILQQHHQELDKLRRELLYRNSVNREASVRVASQKELLKSRKDEIARIDKRIAELQQRLQRKRILNQQLASQISAATQAKQAQLKAVQEKAFKEAHRENSADDINTEEHHRTSEDLSEFERGKHDPKYQTLPHNTKFSNSGKGRPYTETSVDSPSNSDAGSSSSEVMQHLPQGVHQASSSLANNHSGVPCSGPVTRTVHSIPTLLPPRDHALAPSQHSAASSGSTTYPVPSTTVGVSSTGYGIATSSVQRVQQASKSLPEDASLKVSVGGGVSSSALQQEIRGQLPSTSLSLSFSQRLNLGTSSAIAHSVHSSSKPISSSSASSLSTVQSHPPNLYINKDVENVRALGHPAGSVFLPTTTANGTTLKYPPEEGTLGDGGKQKPTLPPKPPVPTKPAPPPRQKGDPLVSSTESLHLIGSNQRPNGTSSRPQVFRYASQNVIMSTYTQQQQSKQASESQQDKDNQARIYPPTSTHSESISKKFHGVEAPQEKVQVSINRRIEMPPDFMFPEDETPPSDLLGKLIEDEIARQESEAQQDKADNSHRPPDSHEIHGAAHSALSSMGDVPDRSLAHGTEVERVRVFLTPEEQSAAKDMLNATIRAEETREDHHTDANLEDRNRLDNDVTQPAITNQTSTNNNNNNNAIDLNTNGTSSSSTTEVVRRLKKGNLKTSHARVTRRVSFDPLALLLDASLEGELELVKRTAMEVPNPSAANDEGITALHNAICAGHLDIVTFLVTFGYDVNAQDADGWTPLHCAASCNNVAMVKFLVEHGACVLATTLLDHETAAEKCEQDEEGYDGCSQYLYSVQEKLGIANNGVVYAVYDYDSQNDDELPFKTGEGITVLRRGDEYEREWWWARIADKEGYVPRNLLGLYPRVKSPLRSVMDS